MIVKKATEKEIQRVKVLNKQYERIVVIKSEAEYQKADEFLTMVKRQAKIIKDIRLAMTRPLDESKANVMDYFRPVMNKLADMEKTTKTTMGDYTQKQLDIIAKEEEGRREAEETARIVAEKLERSKAGSKAKEKLEAKMEQAVEKFTKPLTKKVKNTKMHYDFVIIDESKIPDTYKIPDKVKIGKMVRATEGKCVIPGIKVVESITIIGRT